jgi:uncharacterized membrane protein YhaH (DUF805 family)
MEWYLLAWKRAADVSGRSRRREYWTFQLVNMAIAVCLAAILAVVVSQEAAKPDSVIQVVGGFFLITFIPSFTCGIRRLHDIGRSGWWFLLGFVPLGGLVIFVFSLMDSEPGANEYGGNPKGLIEQAQRIAY